MSFGILVFPMAWSRHGETQEFFDKFKTGHRTHKTLVLNFGATNPNAQNAMIARKKKPSGPLIAVIAKGRKRGIAPNALVAQEKRPNLLI